MRQAKTVNSIRNRLFLLLLRAFLIAVVFLILFTLLATGFVLTNPSQSNPIFRPPTVARLETYYVVRGSWDGVNLLFTNPIDSEALQWKTSILLNSQGQVVVYDGQPVDPSRPPAFISPDPATIQPIIVNGRQVGTLVHGQSARPSVFIVLRFLQPVLLASLFLAIFATLIGLLLTRRVVSPLAEVIAAAEDIAGGRLERRISPKGPDDLRDLSNSFNKMADALERNDRERRDMLADIAHELRTPLTVMRGRLEGVMDGIYPADENSVGPALEEAYLLERLVEDLRLLTLAESHQLVFEKHELDLLEITSRSISMFQAEADEKKISLELAPSIQQALIVGDPLRTEQVVGNLLSNALRYVPAGGRIWVEVLKNENEIKMAISDNGPGIPEADLPYIFNRFWRGEKSRGRETGGAGLGLAITKVLVEGQGGRITAQNRPGGGLQICLYFPLNGISEKVSQTSG